MNRWDGRKRRKENSKDTKKRKRMKKVAGFDQERLVSRLQGRRVKVEEEEEKEEEEKEDDARYGLA